MNKFILFCLIASICCGDINKAVAYLVALPLSSVIRPNGKYVADALEAGGFSFTRQPSAYMYRTKGVLAKMRFKEISKPNPFKKGDIAVTENNSAHPHGYIAMHTGSNWRSDFVQKSEFIFTSNQPKVHYYRYQE